MAYTFDRINTLFRGKDENADAMGGKSGSYGAFKTSTGGDVTDGSTGSATSTGGEYAPQQSSAQSGAAAIKRNVSRTNVPGFTQQIRGQVEAGNSGLDSESNTYKSGIENTDYGVSAEDIQAGMSGNSEKLGKVQTRLATPQYGQVAAFKPQTDTEIEDAEMLGSDGGIKRLMSRQAGSRYNAGEAAFDVSLLRRNQNFNQIADQLSREGKELSQKSTKLQADLPREGQAVANRKYAEGTESAKKYLGDLGKGIIDPVAAKAAEINAKRSGLKTTPNQTFIGTKTSSAKKEAEKQLGLLNPRAVKELENAGIDPLKYYGVGKNVIAADLYSPDEAAKFNRIQEMLGEGNLITPGQGAGDDEYFDDQNYQADLVTGASTKRGAKDTEGRAAIDKINATATTNAATYNQGLAPEESSEFKKIMASILAANPNLSQGIVSKLNSLNPADYINERSTVDYSDVYTPEEAAQINAYYDDLGLPTPKVASKNYRQDVSIDSAGINKFIQDQKDEEARRLYEANVAKSQDNSDMFGLESGISALGRDLSMGNKLTSESMSKGSEKLRKKLRL